MATYVPTLLKTTTALTASAATIYTPSGATTGVIRTAMFNSATAAQTATMSIGADAVGTRVLDAYALGTNVPSIFNWWLVIPNGVNVQAKSNSTNVQVTLSGLEYS